MEQIAAIIGAGLIGRAWARVFARAGWQVRLYDSVATQLDAARGHPRRASPSSRRRDLSLTFRSHAR